MKKGEGIIWRDKYAILERKYEELQRKHRELLAFISQSAPVTQMAYLKLFADGPLSSYDIWKSENKSHKADYKNIYTRLKRLQQRGLIEKLNGYVYADKERKQHGAIYYKITNEGKRILQELKPTH